MIMSEYEISDLDENNMRIEYFCHQCDGTNVRCMCEWDNETQRWVIEGESWCDDCDEPIYEELGTREINSNNG